MMLLSLTIANCTNALKCSTRIEIHNIISLDPSVFADLWMLATAIMLLTSYMYHETKAQLVYISNRLTVLYAVLLLRTLIFINALSGCNYTPMFVYVVVIIPMRVVQHSILNNTKNQPPAPL